MFFASFPAAWLLVVAPFVSALVISQTPPLRRLVERRDRSAWLVGIIGLGLLFGGEVGLLPAGSALPVMLAAGAVSGFALLWAPRPGGGGGGSDGDDRLRDPPRTGPPESPLGHRPPDWGQFDRLRARWERRPTIKP
ncbi:MAG TPA: hypothetical protein VG325_16590 [Solirubrobacteraceae bacterium]|jgi:hypothetical protein|nr:hypothetical protein [Solirubrobacteraceae bacterium]